MKRSTLDKLLSSAGILIAVVLLAAAWGLMYTHDFVHNQVTEQLASQKINFPAAGSKALDALKEEDKTAVSQYAGQQVLTGDQARVFADNYIGAHLKNIGGGKTYSELSTDSRANPDDAKLEGQVSTVFRGETLRGLLLNAYAFDTVAVVAKKASYVALGAGIVMVILSGLGYFHAGIASKPASKKRK